jgi:hypothetical protein
MRTAMVFLTVQTLQQRQQQWLRAEQAYQAAKDALTTANTDGLINPAEKAALEQAKADAEAAKAAAQAKVDALPSTEQTELQGRLDDLNQ